MPIPRRRVPTLLPLISGLLPVALLLVFAASASSQNAQSVDALQKQPASIGYFEAFNPVSVDSGRSSIAFTGAKQRLDVAAFGRSYRLELEQNTRLTGADLSDSSANSLRLLRGSVNGKIGSWVRLLVSQTQTQGLIWDGQDLYAVEPAAAIADLVAPPLQAPTTGSVIFRLADTQIFLSPDFCGAQAADDLSSNGLAEYEALSAELSRMQIAALDAATPVQGIEISALADAAFRNQYSSNADAQDAVWARMNNLDGIFSAQAGVRMLTPSLTVYDNNPGALSSSTNASTLLDSLGSMRSGSASLQSRGLTHLFTGRDLDGSTVGIAYVGTVCNSRYGVGLTESRTRGAWIDSLIAAHEIGHNLGAIHDGEGICANTPLTYIMAPQITGSSTFSQCSLNKIFPTLQTASCLVAVDTPNPAIASNLGTTKALPANLFAWTLSAKNSGKADATGLSVQITFQPALVVEQSSVSGGSCISGAGLVTCTFDTLSAGETRLINLSLRSDSVGSIAVAATISANADSNLADNTGSGQILIEPAADISVGLNAPASLELNANADVAFTLSNLGPSDAADIAVTVTLPTGIDLQAIELIGGSCNIQATPILCSLTSLPMSENASGHIRFVTTTEGAKQFQISVSAVTVDPVAGNNSTNATVQTVAAVTISSSSTERGGGGGMGWSLLGMLCVLNRLRRPLSSSRQHALQPTSQMLEGHCSGLP